MIRQLPIIPTILVLAACGVMVWLGIWQLGRAEEKAELIAKSEAALADDTQIFSGGFADEETMFHKASFLCERVLGIRETSGRSQSGQSGWSYVAQCETGGPASYAPLEMTDYVIERVEVTLGWSRELREVEFAGGFVEGLVGPANEEIGRVVADPPLAGLEANARPDPKDLPNNHLAYAGQWFFFALTALIIYWFAVKSRTAKRD